MPRIPLIHSVLDVVVWNHCQSCSRKSSGLGSLKMTAGAGGGSNCSNHTEYPGCAARQPYSRWLGKIEGRTPRGATSQNAPERERGNYGMIRRAQRSGGHPRANQRSGREVPRGKAATMTTSPARKPERDRRRPATGHR